MSKAKKDKQKPERPPAVITIVRKKMDVSFLLSLIEEGRRIRKEEQQGSA